VEIATSVLGGTYYPLGRQLAWLLEQGDYAAIGKAQAVPTKGSIDNIERLLKGTELALAGESKLLTILDKEQREDLFDLSTEQLDTMAERISTLAKLYTSVLHVVAGPAFPIEYVQDLDDRSSDEDGKKPRIYIGGSGSGTRRTARALLEKLGVDILGGGFDIDDSKSYTDAAEKLVKGDVDLAFILEAMPSEEVEMALASGCRLIRLVEPGDIIPRESGDTTEIPKFLYQGQTLPIETIGDPAYLVARSDLDAEVVVSVLDALFDNAKDLATGHFIATDIRKSGLQKHDRLKQHPGVELFEQRESSKLLIATAGASGSYYETGKIIQGLLEDRRLESTVLQTNGSLENLTYLAEERPTLAIVQYDVVLAAHSYDARAVYKVQAPTISDRNGELLDPDPNGGWGIPKVDGVSRVATLYDEAMYIFARTAGLGQGDARFNLDRHEGARVCFGPPDSGTAILARAVFGESQGKLDRAEYLSTGQMIRQLQNGHLDIGIAVQKPNVALVPQLLADENITLVPIGPQRIERIRGSAIQPFEVDRHYGMGEDGNELLTTIKTNAVLVVNEHVPDAVVETIAEAVIAGSDLFLERGDSSQEQFLSSIVTASSSIKLHPAAEEYYKKNNLLPSLGERDWLQLAVHLAGLILALASLGSLTLAARNQRRVHAVEREVVAVDLSAASSDSVKMLTRLRAEACAAVKLPWWRKGVLSTTKWRSIDALIEQRISLARQLQTRSLAKKIEDIDKLSETDPTKAEEEYARVRNWVKKLFGTGEVDAEQCDFLLRLLPP
jgi:TRAP transporter TAXI family solute receptor